MIYEISLMDQTNEKTGSKCKICQVKFIFQVLRRMKINLFLRETTYNQLWREDQLLCRVQRQKVALIKQLWLLLEDVVKGRGRRKQAQEGVTGIYY